MQKLIAGLKLLSQSDPCVETFQQQTGEYVILTAGEIHFEVRTSLEIVINANLSSTEMFQRPPRAICTGRNTSLEAHRSIPRDGGEGNW
jgi:hypothetical protein